MRIEKKKLKKALKILLIPLIFFSFIEVTFWILDINSLILYEPYEWGARNNIPYKVNDCISVFHSPENEDKVKVLILGDSRPEMAFNPIYFDNLTNNRTISYNLCISGTAVRVISFLIKHVIIPKVRPDVIFWDIDISGDFISTEFIDNEEATTLSAFMPRFYSNNFDQLGFNKLLEFCMFYFSRLYRYKTLLMPRMLDFYQINLLNINGNDNYRGHYRKYTSMGGVTPSMVNATIYDWEIHNESLDLFKEANNLLKISLEYYLIINGPYQYFNMSNPVVENVYNQTLSSSNYFSMNGNTTFNDNQLYYNKRHLNYNGSLLYTEAVYQKFIANFNF